MALPAFCWNISNNHLQRLPFGKQSFLRLYHPLLQTELLLVYGRGRYGSEGGYLCIAESQPDEEAELVVGRRKLGKPQGQAARSILVHSIRKLLQVLPLGVREKLGMAAQLLHHFIAIYQGGGERLYLTVQLPGTLTLLHHQFPECQ